MHIIRFSFKWAIQRIQVSYLYFQKWPRYLAGNINLFFDCLQRAFNLNIYISNLYENKDRSILYNVVLFLGLDLVTCALKWNFPSERKSLAFSVSFFANQIVFISQSVAF